MVKEGAVVVEGDGDGAIESCDDRVFLEENTWREREREGGREGDRKKEELFTGKS